MDNNKKLPFLNVGCGSKFHKDWVNVDIVSNSEYVIAHNLIKGIPYADNTFEVLYHSQVLEHIPKQEALKFIKECKRVLKDNGVIRIVVPDLENIAINYLKALNEVSNNSTKENRENYNWMMLELYDQTVREKTGGGMQDFLKDKTISNEDFVVDRVGYSAKAIINQVRREAEIGKKNVKNTSVTLAIKKAIFKLFGKGKKFKSVEEQLGAFRLGGEIHMWMYDRYSLSALLTEAGFRDIKVQSPHTSYISNWANYSLDVKEGQVYDPQSLFIEAYK